MDCDDVEACPGLNFKHGFLHSINHRLMLSHDNMIQEQQITQEKVNMKDNVNKAEQRKPRRPTVELYSIPARRKGGDPHGQLMAVFGTRGSCTASDCVRDPGRELKKDLKINASSNVGTCDPAVVTENNCSCTVGRTDFLEFSGREVQESGVRQDKLFGSLDTCKPTNSVFGFSGELNYTSPLRVSTTIHQKPERTCDDSSGSVAERTLRKLLRKKPKEGHALYIKTLNPGVQVEGPTLLSQGVSDLVIEALQDTTRVSNTQLQRIAEVLVANSSISELFSYRMRYIVMFILQKEKQITKPGADGRFVNALLEACQNGKGKNKNVSVTTGLPFLNFVTVMYCCNVFHESARLMCAELIYNHIYAFIKVSSDALQTDVTRVGGANLLPSEKGGTFAGDRCSFPDVPALYYGQRKVPLQ
ncbi:uncharacterized protein LOC135477038 [Liolophura sinensis]|uniref:uncharacterized protein LOC135477038 n=1 Tax=Liolophura sinensis TaxID=3198878 RepID=UPI003158BD7F